MFGQSLVQEGYISELQLLEEKRIRSVPIGQLAIDEGFLVPKDVISILREQVISGDRFGELALAHGILEQDQLRSRLELRQWRNPKVKDILVEKGFVSWKDVETEHKAYALELF